METINNPNGIQTVLCNFRELPLLDEFDFCKALYELTEGTSLPKDRLKEMILRKL